MLNEPKNMRPLNELTEQILLAESRGREITLVDAHHTVDGDDVVSFVVYDKPPVDVEGALQYERRWIIQITLQDGDNPKSVIKTGGVVSLRWEDEDA